MSPLPHVACHSTRGQQKHLLPSAGCDILDLGPCVVCILQMSGAGDTTKLVVVFALSCAGLLGLSYYVSGSWDFLRAVYGVM